MTSTLQLSTLVPKFGLMTICVALCELIGRFVYMVPRLRSRNVTVQPLWKLLPLIVNGCALPVATGVAGLTLLIVGVTTAACVLKLRELDHTLPPPDVLPARTSHQYVVPGLSVPEAGTYEVFGVVSLIAKLPTGLLEPVGKAAWLV